MYLSLPSLSLPPSLSPPSTKGYSFSLHLAAGNHVLIQREVRRARGLCVHALYHRKVAAHAFGPHARNETHARLQFQEMIRMRREVGLVASAV